jgi:phosphohistidine phosphatase SixA
MKVIVVRHATAEPGHPDELRALTDQGRESAQMLGELLAERDPDAVVSSPLLRARQTAERIAAASGLEAAVDERLAPGADADALREAVTGRGDTVVTVGHQPDCSEIVLELTGREVQFPTAGFFELVLD